MKTFKRFCAFFVAICMVFPLISQPASAFSNEDVNNIDAGAYAASNGTRVRSVTIYPLAINLDTNETTTGPGIYKHATFASPGQGEGIYLSKSQTADLITRLENYVSTLDGNYALYGWRVAGTVSFDYDRLQYITYQYQTTGYRSEEYKANLSGSSVTRSFTADIPYPKNVDLDNSYYYARISGVCYFRSSGVESNATFLIAGGFNANV